MYEWLVRTEVTLYSEAGTVGRTGQGDSNSFDVKGGGASEFSIQPSALCHCDRHGDKNGERRTAL